MAEHFYDILDGADETVIVVMAGIRMLSAEESGLRQHIYPIYRPNHNFGNAENRHMFIGQVEILDGKSLSSGDQGEFVIRFMNARGLEEQLVPGRVWRIQHGSKPVAVAEVLHLVEKINSKSKTLLS